MKIKVFFYCFKMFIFYLFVKFTCTFFLTLLYSLNFFFTAITDIGSASFKYDMRRLTEILAFPKAWYRRSIVRRMFLGDLSTSISHTEDDSSTLSSTPSAKTQDSRQKSDKSPLLAKDKSRFTVEQQQQQQQAKLREMGRTFSTESACSESTAMTDVKSSTTAWETLVLFAINFKKLNVHMNMGNVMGNVM